MRMSGHSICKFFYVVGCLLFLPLSSNAQQFTISNNLIYDAWLTPNLRVGARLSPHWSVGLTAGYRPWPMSDTTTRKWRHLLVSPDVRYWTDSVNVHHFFGANLIYSHYNVANVRFPFGMYKSVRDERREGDLGALGVFYGYSWPLGRYWNLEAIIGAAIGYTRYNRYVCGHCGTKIGKSSKFFAMPQLALNIVFNIPGRPRKIEEPVIIPEIIMPVVEEPFVPVLAEAVEDKGRAGELQKENPVLEHISQYRPYTRDLVLRRDKRALYVHFPLGSSQLQADYRDNTDVMGRIVDVTRQIMADSTSSVKVIQVVGLSSIEGGVDGNEKLAKNRALALQHYVQSKVSVPDSLFETVGGGEAWSEFRDQLEEKVATDAQHTAELQKALDIIDSESDPNIRERKLRKMNGGRTWAYIRENILSDQRNSGYIRIYYDYVPDTVAGVINRANELLRTDCGDCHHKALVMLSEVKNDARAQNALGVALYLNGKKAEAKECLRRAAEKGDVDAANNLKEIENKEINK